jgi:hypothetical protein
MRVGLLMALALGATASAQSRPPTDSPPTSLQSLPSGPNYISAPVWAHKPNANELWDYRPERAAREGIAGGGVVDCKAEVDGHLTDCRTIEVRPAHQDYEFAAKLVTERLYRLKPTTADGQPVAGKRVLVVVLWK